MNSLKRYNFTDDHGHPLELCREYIAIHTDYAALEARCAGLEQAKRATRAEAKLAAAEELALLADSVAIWVNRYRDARENGQSCGEWGGVCDAVKAYRDYRAVIGKQGPVAAATNTPTVDKMKYALKDDYRAAFTAPPSPATRPCRECGWIGQGDDVVQDVHLYCPTCGGVKLTEKPATKGEGDE